MNVLKTLEIKIWNTVGEKYKTYEIRTPEECEKIAQIRDSGGDISSYGIIWQTDGGMMMLD